MYTAGTRGAVDFAEFPSHLFELLAPQIHRPAAQGPPMPPAAGGHAEAFPAFHLANQLMLAILDRVTFPLHPSFPYTPTPHTPQLRIP